MNLQLAENVIEQAATEATKRKCKMCIAIVDVGGNLIAFSRMDGAWMGSIDIAIKKARTAVMFNMCTGDLGDLSQPGQSLWGIEHSNDGLITFPGGIPIRDHSQVMMGGIGVSGSTVEDDHNCAAVVLHD